MWANVTSRISSSRACRKRIDRLLDQIRSVVEGHDAHALRESGLDLRDPRFHCIDDVLRVDARSSDDDTADSLLLTLDE